MAKIDKPRDEEAVPGKAPTKEQPIPSAPGFTQAKPVVMCVWWASAP